MTNHYETLGVLKTATQDEIKAAFRRLASQNHPDKKDGDHEAMAAINEAYRVIGDPEARARYDDSGFSHPDPLIAQGRGIALLHFMLVLDESGGMVDVVAEAKARIRREIGNKDVSIQANQLEINMLHKHLHRFHLKKRNAEGENFLTGAIRQRIDSLQSNIDDLEGTKRRMRAALQFLSEYSDSGPPNDALRSISIPPTGPGGYAWPEGANLGNTKW